MNPANLNGDEQISQRQPAAPARSPWEPPALTFLGKVGDLVQGGGKSGPNFDSDPQGTRKTGGG
jgi:hypothetical protein